MCVRIFSFVSLAGWAKFNSRDGAKLIDSDTYIGEYSQAKHDAIRAANDVLVAAELPPWESG